MNRKIECLQILIAKAIGRKNAVDSVDLARLGAFTVPEASVYLRLLWKEENAIQRSDSGRRMTSHHRARATYLYWIEEGTDVEALMRRSVEVSERGRFKPAPPQFSAAALVGCWR